VSLIDVVSQVIIDSGRSLLAGIFKGGKPGGGRGKTGVKSA
jgi:hypothetical protein